MLVILCVVKTKAVLTRERTAQERTNSSSVLRELPLPYSLPELRLVSACHDPLSHERGSYR